MKTITRTNTQCTLTSTVLLYTALILLNVSAVNGSFLRGSRLQRTREGNIKIHRRLMEWTELYEGQSATCYEHEDKVYRWTEGKLHWYQNPKVADSWKIRWRPEMARVDCRKLKVGEDMPTKIHELVEDGTIATCLNNKEKVYWVENGHLRWFPNPPIASSWEMRWRRLIIVIDCEVFPFGPDMPMKEA